MKISKTRMLISLLVLSTSSCSQPSFKNQKDENGYALSVAEHIPVGSFSKKEATEKLGVPDHILKIKTGDAWVYLNSEKNASRLSLVFDSSESLIQVNWFTTNSDPESKIDNALKRFPSAHFKNGKREWTEGHIISSDEYYSDDSIGLTLITTPSGKSINSIVFEKPSVKTK